jgi:hypothetical protein
VATPMIPADLARCGEAAGAGDALPVVGV